MSNVLRRILPWVLAALLLQAMVLWAAGEVTRYRLWQAANIQEVRLNTLLALAEQGVRAHVRPGPALAITGVTAVFDALANLPELAGLRLTDASGTVLLTSGFPDEGEKFPYSVRLERYHRQIEPIPEIGPPGGGRGLMRGPGHGPRWMGQRGPDDSWQILPPGPLLLELWLDPGQDNAVRQIQRDGWLMALGGSLAVLVGLVAAAMVLRQRRLRQDLRVAREEAAHQARLAQLGAGLAHEVKNPLGVARGLAQSILDEVPPGSSLSEKAAALIDEADRAARRINLFLRYARPPEPRPVPVDLEALGDQLSRLLEDEAVRKQVQLDVSLQGRIMADPDLLRRALMNLLLNALKACADPESSVRLSVEPDHGDTVTLCVADTGVGIAPEDLPRVTEPFFGRFEQGTGLGLSIVSEIARAHGWKMEIQSVPGQGTTVRLRGIKKTSLPAEQPAASGGQQTGE